MNKREVGSQWEQKTVEYLQTIGITVLYKNFRCKIGEIDIIGIENDTYIFIEVKYRSWFYTSIGDELVPEDMAILTKQLIQENSRQSEKWQSGLLYPISCPPVQNAGLMYVALIMIQ